MDVARHPSNLLRFTSDHAAIAVKTLAALFAARICTAEVAARSGDGVLTDTEFIRKVETIQCLTVAIRAETRRVTWLRVAR